MPQRRWETPCAPTNTQCSQINKLNISKRVFAPRMPWGSNALLQSTIYVHRFSLHPAPYLALICHEGRWICFPHAQPPVQPLVLRASAGRNKLPTPARWRPPKTPRLGSSFQAFAGSLASLWLLPSLPVFCPAFPVTPAFLWLHSCDFQHFLAPTWTGENGKKRER